MSKTILLADDSVTIQKVVELTFMEEDYEVVGVSSGDEAIARLETVDPDLVIADVHMPGASGYEVCRKVKGRSPQVPVILLVGTFEPFEESSARECGADSHLRKPFDSQDLLRLAKELTAAPHAAPAEPAAEAPAPAAAAPAPAASAPEQKAAAASAAPASAEAEGLSDEAVEKIARRVVALLGDSVVREVAWEVVPDLAEVVIKDRLKELESQVE